MVAKLIQSLVRHCYIRLVAGGPPLLFFTLQQIWVLYPPPVFGKGGFDRCFGGSAGGCDVAEKFFREFSGLAGLYIVDIMLTSE